MQHLIAGFDAGPKSASGIGNDKTLAVAIWRRPKATDFSGISILVAGPRRFQRRGRIETCPQDWKFWVRSGSNKPAKEFP